MEFGVLPEVCGAAKPIRSHSHRYHVHALGVIGR